MDRLCFCSVLCLLCLCARLFICALWSPAGKGLTSWHSFVVSNCECHFPIGILGQVWYLIVSIPDLCTLTYLEGWSSADTALEGIKRRWCNCRDRQGVPETYFSGKEGALVGIHGAVRYQESAPFQSVGTMP